MRHIVNFGCFESLMRIGRIEHVMLDVRRFGAMTDMPPSPPRCSESPPLKAAALPCKLAEPRPLQSCTARPGMPSVVICSHRAPARIQYNDVSHIGHGKATEHVVPDIIVDQRRQVHESWAIVVEEASAENAQQNLRVTTSQPEPKTATVIAA